CGIDCSEEEREIVASGKWQEDGKDQAPTFGVAVAAILLFNCMRRPIRRSFGVRVFYLSKVKSVSKTSSAGVESWDCCRPPRRQRAFRGRYLRS
ncbi:hypothetical protein ABTP03_19385, partial [Acinetobacter baumannii]